MADLTHGRSADSLDWKLPGMLIMLRNQAAHAERFSGMATKKASPAPAGSKPAPATRKEAQPAPAQRAIPNLGSNDPRQLMREAAWARMFGRTEAKNPFTR